MTKLPRALALTRALATSILVFILASGCAGPNAKANQGEVLSSEEIDKLVETQNQTAETDSRIICRYVADTGSHIKRKSCATVKQIRAEREAARRTLERQAGQQGRGDR